MYPQGWKLDPKYQPYRKVLNQRAAARAKAKRTAFLDSLGPNDYQWIQGRMKPPCTVGSSRRWNKKGNFVCLKNKGPQKFTNKTPASELADKYYMLYLKHDIRAKQGVQAPGQKNSSAALAARYYRLYQKYGARAAVAGVNPLQLEYTEPDVYADMPALEDDLDMARAEGLKRLAEDQMGRPTRRRVQIVD